jgi:hypothetical protein
MPKTVYVKIEGGVLDVYRLSPGIQVDVIDHDVEANDQGSDPAICHCKRGGGSHHRHYVIQGKNKVLYHVKRSSVTHK